MNYVLSDIHGNRQRFDSIMEQIALQPENTLYVQPDDDAKQRAQAALDACGWKVDTVLSHTCPYKYEPREAFLPMIDQRSVDDSTERWLDAIEDRLSYERWYCGHWHINKHIDKMHFLFEDVEAAPAE